MSDERRDGSGGSAAVVVIVVVLALLALLVVGGGGTLVFFRMTTSRQLEMVEARAKAEMVAVQMDRERAILAAQLAEQVAASKLIPPEIELSIDAAGICKFEDKLLEDEESLRNLFLQEREIKGPGLQLVISADLDTRFDSLNKVVRTAAAAGISQHRIKTAGSVALPPK